MGVWEYNTSPDGATQEPNQVRSVPAVRAWSSGRSSQAALKGNGQNSSIRELKTGVTQALTSLKGCALAGHVGQTLPCPCCLDFNIISFM